jgi:hypothetical protein
MNAVFTIVAKNYLGQAHTLGDSLRAVHPDLAFHIILADEADGLLELPHEPYPTIEARQMGIDSYEEMAFKYDLVEFATAIKPFVFEYLFRRFGYERIIYFDPDIFVYSSLDVVFAELDENFMVLTPHMTKIEISHCSAISEETILYVGTFNLGFVAFNNSESAQAVIRWWKDRLRDKGYADRVDALHVDQKWMDLIPAFFDRGVRIARHPGFNVSHWNLHERHLTVRDGVYMLDDQPLVFFHYSGFDPRYPDLITGQHKQSVMTLHDKPEYRALFQAYADHLGRNRPASRTMPYSYGRFANGVRIFSFHRRLYRRLTDLKFAFAEPFATTAGSFYDVLGKNGLLIVDESVDGEYSQSTVANAGAKLRMLRRAMLLMKKLLGIKSYHLLLRVLSVLSRPEEQTFLLQSLKLDVPPRFGTIPGSPPSRGQSSDESSDELVSMAGPERPGAR